MRAGTKRPTYRYQPAAWVLGTAVVADVQQSLKNNSRCFSYSSCVTFIIITSQSFDSPVHYVLFSDDVCPGCICLFLIDALPKFSFFPSPTKLRSVSSQVKDHRRITDQPSPRHRWSRPRSHSLPREKAEQGASHQKGQTSLSFPHRALSEPTSLKKDVLM